MSQAFAKGKRLVFATPFDAGEAASRCSVFTRRVNKLPNRLAGKDGRGERGAESSRIAERTTSCCSLRR